MVKLCPIAAPTPQQEKVPLAAIGRTDYRDMGTVRRPLLQSRRGLIAVAAMVVGSGGILDLVFSGC